MESQYAPGLHSLERGAEVCPLDDISQLRDLLRPPGGDLRVAAGAERSVHGAGVHRVRRHARARQPPAQLPHEHHHAQLGDVHVDEEQDMSKSNRFMSLESLL